MKVRGVLTGLATAGLLASAAQADVLPGAGLYQLHNHPDGSEAMPLYGLRLDELFDVTGDHDVFTFDFDHADSDMLLDYDGSSIHIFGTVYGGLDSGSSYDSDWAGLWEVDFTYASSALWPGDDDLAVMTPDYTNTGTITRLDTHESISLWDYGMDFGYTFRLGDEDNDAGHRGYEGISGWGWMNHTSMTNHVASSDWLFTVDPNPIPEPAGVLLAALGGLLIARRRNA